MLAINFGFWAEKKGIAAHFVLYYISSKPASRLRQLCTRVEGNVRIIGGQGVGQEGGVTFLTRRGVNFEKREVGGQWCILKNSTTKQTLLKNKIHQNYKIESPIRDIW